MKIGLTDIPVTVTGGLTVRLAVTLTPTYEAVRTTEVDDVTFSAVAVKDAVVEPAGTVTEMGTEAAELELDRVRVMPAGPAGAEMVTVAREVCPLVIAPGVRDMLVGTIWLTVRPAVALTPA